MAYIFRLLKFGPTAPEPLRVVSLAHFREELAQGSVVTTEYACLGARGL
jgi:hypothetical protein